MGPLAWMHSFTCTKLYVHIQVVYYVASEEELKWPAARHTSQDIMCVPSATYSLAGVSLCLMGTHCLDVGLSCIHCDINYCREKYKFFRSHMYCKHREELVPCPTRAKSPISTVWPRKTGRLTSLGSALEETLVETHCIKHCIHWELSTHVCIPG